MEDMEDKVLDHDDHPEVIELAIDTTPLVEGDEVFIVGPHKHVFQGQFAKVLKLPAKSPLATPVDPFIEVSVDGPHLTTVRCRRSNLFTVFG